MTTVEVRDWMLKQFRSMLQEIESLPAPEWMTDTDTRLLCEWLFKQYESRITLELCEKLLAAAGDPGFEGLRAQEVSRIFSEIMAESQQNIGGSRVEFEGEQCVDMRKLRLWLQHPDHQKRPQ
jgi:hypothetical protein